MQITPLDPMTCDLDTADEMAAVVSASREADGVVLPAPIGPTRLLFLQHTSDGRPVGAVFVARNDAGRMLGYAEMNLPWEENTDAAMPRGHVHPDHRRRGVGSALLEACVDLARACGRTRLLSGAFTTGPGLAFLGHHGWTVGGVPRMAVRRLDLHGTPRSTWERLYDEAAAHAGDYELVRMAGPAPDERLEDLVAVHDAINDAPLEDPDDEPDVWTADRVRRYDAAMAARRQTTYRVLARHRGTGAWAGMSLLCVDEFLPTVGFQEDTSVVRAHRGHRLGLLMKADMLRWITDERPEVAATDTWNATDNHHMIAVNERLGCRLVAEHQGARTRLG
ncbi:N-acetyltransferase [Nocardioides guangzhouensis]|uniref:N-acetyltransferase n=1 Tax=Nocardioides guangzhouensis TaxID=2497878 RepID=A0A4V1XZ89_9ACTN|nr:GNAT family N-acetyltransferase [Nocardioides guangzhouensis]RYP85909.1 N-acetyltransferase [Nocardioides guangzhouensis]